MRKLHMGHCLIGIAIAGVALLAFGVKSSTLLVLVFALACPLMMVVMMRTMMGGQEDHSGHGCEHDPQRSKDRHTQV